jgi:Rps23 Pro-64 3,4-dihydroxylase Tpa1-like proline 4-hydroxylase
MNNYLDTIKTNGYLILNDIDLNFDRNLLENTYSIFDKYRSNPESYFKKYRKLGGYHPISSLDEFNKIIKDSELDEFAPFQLWRAHQYSNDDFQIFKPYLNHLVNTIYGKTMDDLRFISELTCFTKGSYITPHVDKIGSDGNLCVILSYFSEPWDFAWGGNLILSNNETILPNLGTIVVLDFTENNIEHEVTKVIEDNKYRLCLTTFLSEITTN